MPCNNDLLAANFIDDGETIWLIDYEYSGNNDACFELGNIWGECQLPDEALEALVAEYYGRPLRNKVARAMLLGLAGKYGWTLWGAIQAAVSADRLRFLVLGDGTVRGRVRRLLLAGFGRLLDEVQRGLMRMPLRGTEGRAGQLSRGQAGGVASLPADPSPPAGAVVIIGGGVIGTSVAYHLTLRGRDRRAAARAGPAVVRHDLARGRPGRAAAGVGERHPAGAVLDASSMTGWRPRPAWPPGSAGAAA